MIGIFGVVALIGIPTALALTGFFSSYKDWDDNGRHDPR